jgi:putative glutathione S-transferase
MAPLQYDIPPILFLILKVPVLWDKKTGVIVNNESSEIIRMLNSEFNEFATNKSLDLYPEDLRSKIDSINEWVYPHINNGNL